MPRAEMLGALLTYRAIYYLAPLLIAAVVYASLEVRSSARRKKHVASPQGRVAPR
jgi:hypothetical protein